MGYNKLLISILILAISGIAVAQEPQPKYVMPYFETVVHEVNLLKMTVNELISLDTNVFKLALSKLGEKEANLFITKVFSIVPAYDSGLLSAAIANKNYDTIRSIAGKYIPADKVEALVGYMQGTVKAELKIDTTFTIWQGYKKDWIYDLLKHPLPPIDENSFIAINDLKLDYQKLYDNYFNSHTGKTKIIWEWNITKENYIRQEIPNFVSRYKDKIHSHMVGGGYFNSFDSEPPYDTFFECIRQNIALIYTGNINAVIELCVAYPTSTNGTIWINTLLPYLDIQGLAVWGYHKKTENVRTTLSIAKEKIDEIAPDKYKILIGQFTGVDLERAKIAEELNFKGIQFSENPL